MKFNTAVMALLRRTGPGGEAALEDLPRSLSGTLRRRSLVMCDHFVRSWHATLDPGIFSNETRSIATFPDGRVRQFRVHRWGTMRDHVPFLLFFLHQNPHFQLSSALATVRNSVVASIFFSAPKVAASMPLLGLFRSMILHLLPTDLTMATTAHLICTFIVLSLIQHEREEYHRFGHGSSSLAPRADTLIAQESRAVAKQVAELPKWLQDYFIIGKDVPTLMNISAEIIRRLPRRSENLPGDYLKTLLEAGSAVGTSGVGGRDNVITVRQVFAQSSTTCVTAHELLMFIPKLFGQTLRVEMWRSSSVEDTAANDYDDYERQQHNIDRKGGEGGQWSTSAETSVRFYSEDGLKALVSAVKNLCLTNHVKEVMEARRLLFSEWLFILRVATLPELPLREAMMDTLCTALRVAEVHRLRQVSQSSITNSTQASVRLKGTLFPDLTPKQLRWMLRTYMASIFTLDFTKLEDRRVVELTVPMLWEYVRVLDTEENVSVLTVLRDYSVLKTLWVCTRFVWAVDDQGTDASASDKGFGSGSGGDAGEASAPLQRSTTGPDGENFFTVAPALLSVLGRVLQKAGAFAEPTPPHLAPVLSTTAAVPPPELNSNEKKRGSGFARTAQPFGATPTQPATDHLQRWNSKHSVEADKELFRDVERLFLDCQMALSSHIIQSGAVAHGAAGDAMGTALRTLEMTARRFAPDVADFQTRVRLGAQQQQPSASRRAGQGFGRGDGAGATAGASQHGARKKPSSSSRTVARHCDVLHYQTNRFMELAKQLLRVTGKEVLTEPERHRLYVCIASIATAFVRLLQAMKQEKTLSYRLQRTIFTFSVFYTAQLQPHMPKLGEETEAHHPLLEVRSALQQVAQLVLDTVVGLLAPSASSAACHGPSDILSLADLIDAALLLGQTVGLTSEAMPHAGDLMAKMFHELSGCLKARKEQGPRKSLFTSNVSVTAKITTTAGRSAEKHGATALDKTAQLLYRCCGMGLNDERCLAAATAALRSCGNEDTIKVMPTRDRVFFVTQAVYCYRALQERFTISRHHRRLMMQLLVVAARMALDRLAFDDPTQKANAKLRAKSMLERRSLALLMWQLSSLALNHVDAQIAVDKPLTILLLYVKRTLQVPELGEKFAPSQPNSIAHLESCEAALYESSRAFLIFTRRTIPETRTELIIMCNSDVMALIESAKVAYRRIMMELSNGVSNLQRHRWQMHIDVLATVVLRYQVWLAPSVFYHALRELSHSHRILSFTNLFTPVMQDALVLAAERVLLHVEHHRNNGDWWWLGVYDTPIHGKESASGTEDEDAFEKGTKKLISYLKLPYLFLMQDVLRDLDRRVYLVQLADQLVEEMEEEEEERARRLSGDDADASVSASRPIEIKAVFTGLAKDLPPHVVRSTRISLLYALRKLQF